MLDFENAAQGFPLLTGAGMFVYLFFFLFRRGDAQQLENIRELKEQRDRATARAEKAEAKLEEVDEAFDEFRSEQRTVRHELKNEAAAARMERDLWEQRARECGWTRDMP